ncbi:MAG: M15 family metallopeptidase [Clostridiales bacterium]|nr:M15 family metallopeptidase [Clostridiales bacterium]
MSTKRRRKSMTKYKRTELKIVFGGFVAVLIITLILGFSIISKRKANTVVTTTEKQTTQQTEEKTEKPEDKTEEPSSEEDSTEEKTTEDETEESTDGEDTTADENSSPFNPSTISIDESKWELTLLNANYKLPDGYVPELTPAIPGSGESLDKRVQPYYEKMYNAAKAEGVLLTPYSGYRSIATQTRLHTNKVDSYKSQGYSNYEAEKMATRWSMLPGCSEHNFGVAMDICNTRDDFNMTEQYAWLVKHAAEYGFIERYKGEKEQYTGVAAEPWHWRFVGVENAKAINESGLCLEEYLGKTD